MRTAGVLMPVASLPSDYGIGCFSKEAYEFVDNVKESGLSLWQILPLGPTGFGDSPYSSFSTFAGNPYFIDPDELVKKGWLKKGEPGKYDFGKNAGVIDYGKIYASRFKMLRKAFKRSGIQNDRNFNAYVKKNAFWLNDYALYMAIKDHRKGEPWLQWEKDLRIRDKKALAKVTEQYAEDILFYEFLQFEFDDEWKKLKKYANKSGVKIMGDAPIYVAMDSADTWAHPELFQLDKDMNPASVAGCPPDYFSPEGQLWGNPLYDWEFHRKTGFKWWIRRLKRMFEFYDVVRIDHFRGFDSYYSIPYGSTTAIKGHWEKGPGYGLFAAVKKELGEKEVIAEDLGLLTESVRKLVKRTGYPGMKILEFAFDPEGDSDYMPHNLIKNSVVYTGTHDNDTCLGWYRSIDKKTKKFVDGYMDIGDIPEKEIPWVLIRAAMGSVADYCIIPMQDFLSLGSKARINVPSTLGNNWMWRMKKNAFTKRIRNRIRKNVTLFRRGNLSRGKC